MNATALEQDGIRQAINFYIDGLREGSVETLKQGFHSEATMCGYFGETLMVTPIQGLYDFVSSNLAPKWSRRYRGFMILLAQTLLQPKPASRLVLPSQQSKLPAV